MINQILFNEIPIKNIEKSIEWYKNMLNLTFIWHSKEEKLAQLNLPSGQMLFLVETKDDTTATFTVNGEKHQVIGFHTTRIEELYKHLVDNEVKVEPIIDDGAGNKFLHFYDLNGNKFNVQCDN